MGEPQVSVWIRAKDLATSVFQKAEAGVRSFGKVATNVGRDLLAIGAGTAAAIAGLTKLSQRGADYLGVQKAFNKITGDGEGALRRLQVATGGVVDNFTLMAQFNRAVSSGMVRSVDEFTALSKVATTISDVIGEDDAQAFQDLAEAMDKGKVKGLANLGILVDQDTAYQQYAKSIGKVSSELTDAQKREAIRNAGMKEATRLANDLSGGEIEAADAANRFAAQLSNVRDQISLLVATSPSVSSFFDILRDGLKSIGNHDLEDEALQSSIDKMTDPAALRARFKALDQERQRLEGEQDTVIARRPRQGHVGEDRIHKTFLVDQLNDQLVANQREAELVAARLTKVSGGEGKLNVKLHPGADEGTDATGPVGKIEKTVKNIGLLLNAFDDAQQKLSKAQLDEAIAPSEKTIKALKDAREEVDRIKQGLAQFGGAGAAQRILLATKGAYGLGDTQKAFVDQVHERLFGSSILTAAHTPLSDMERRRENASGFQSGKGLGNVRFQDANKIRRLEADTSQAADDFTNAGATAIATFGELGKAAIDGSQITEQSVVSMFTNILQSLPKVDALTGAIIGVAGGLLGALFGHKQEKAQVHLASVSPEAARDMQQANTGPTVVNVQVISPNGQVLDQFRYETARSERRDAVVRVPAMARGI